VQRPSKLAQVVAAVMIALFWCLNAVATTAGMTTLATAVGAVTSPAEAGDRRRRGRRRSRGRRRHRRWRGNRWEWYYVPYWYYQPYYY
jgi:hypothetical protein